MLHISRRELASAAMVFGSRALGRAQETSPVGKTEADQARNAKLLSGYDYKNMGNR